MKTKEQCLLEIKVEHKIGDTVTHKTSKKELLIVGYEYVQTGGIKYIAISEDQKQLYCLPYELEPGSTEMPIGFFY